MFGKTVKDQGIGHVTLLIFMVVLLLMGAVGLYVYSQREDDGRSTASHNSKDDKKSNKPSDNNPADPYANWGTAKVTTPQISFRYPEGWTQVVVQEGKNIEVKSPVSNNRYFSVSLIAGKARDANLNFLGNAPGITVAELSLSNSKVFYLVAQKPGDNITGLGLATTEGSANTSFGIIDPQKNNNVTMVASLISDTDATETHDLEAYTNHSSYGDVVNIFRSLSGDGLRK